MAASRSLRVRGAEEREGRSFRAPRRLVGAEGGASTSGVRHQQTRRYRSGEEPPAPPAQRGRTPSPRAPGRDLPHPGSANGRLSGLQRSPAPPGPGGELPDSRGGSFDRHEPHGSRPPMSHSHVALRGGPRRPVPANARTVATKLLRALVLVYRGATAHRSPSCRFIPSCSQYALDALDGVGARRALPLIMRRLARCRPGGPFGYDPAPDAATSTGPAVPDGGTGTATRTSGARASLQARTGEPT